MKLEKIGNLLTWLLVGLLAAACLSVWLAFTLSREHRAELLRMHDASDELNKVRLGVYALSQNAQRYLMTTDETHLQAYWNTSSIGHARGDRLSSLLADRLDAEEVQLMAAAAAQADELERLQLEAIAAAREGRWNRGVDILHSVLYLYALQGVLEPLHRVEDNLHNRAEQRIAVLEARARLATIIAVALLIVSVAVVLLVLRRFYYRRVLRPLMKLTDSTHRLLQGATDVRYPGLAEASEIGDLSRALSRYQGVAQELDSKSRQLAEAETWYRQIIEFAPDGMLVVDLHGTVLIANPKAHELFGYAAGELIGESVDQLLPSDLQAAHAGLRECFMAFERQYRSGNVAGDLRGRDLRGREFPIEVGLTRLPVREGRAACVCVSVRDITERKRYEKAIADQLELRRVLLDTLSYPVFFKDAELRYIGFNQAFLDFLGVQREELEGKTVLDFKGLPEHDRLLFQQANEQVSREGGRYTREAEIPYADGVSRPTIYSLSAYRGCDGKVAGLVGTLVDVSAQKAAELAQAHAKELAEEATRLKSDFLANMSHEIRTPMNAILGMAHLALGTELDAKQRGFVEKIHTAAQGLLGIINDILDFSKIEAGKMHFEQADFFLEDVLADALDLAALKAQEKGLELLVDISTEVPNALVGDPLRLGQVLNNLLSNALKFTAKGEVTLAVQEESDGGSVSWLRFEVRDTGIGLSAEQRERLFESFSQADSSTSRRYGGTGLGLAISKRIVNLLGGDITVVSTPGQGSTFTFRIPFGLQADQHRLQLDVGDLRGLRILVVDDNATAREIFHSMLSTFGFDVTTASNAGDALQLLHAACTAGRPFRLVIMDWMMPGVDGLQAIRAIREDDELRETPSFMVATSYNRDELLELVGDLPIEGVLIKPVTPSTLLASLQRVFGKDAAMRPRSAQMKADVAEAREALRGTRILLVEDNLLNQEVGVELLKRAGIEVDVAGNGEEALAQLAQHSYDAVLMDCQMPVMDGFEATRRIRAQPRFTQLPVLAMTANTMAGDRQRCLAAGMNDHISKPVDVNQLFTTLQRWVRPGSARARLGDGDALGMPLPEVPGLAIEPALRRLGGDFGLLRSLLVRFCDSQADGAEQIRRALDAGERETATRIAHTLKGLAGNIGAERLATTAAQLEAHMRHGQDDAAQAHLPVLADELHELVQRIEESLPALIEPPPSHAELPLALAVPRQAELLAALDRLRELLEQDDGDAGPYLARQQAALAELGLARQADELRSLVAHYRFDEALGGLATLRQDLQATDRLSASATTKESL